RPPEDGGTGGASGTHAVPFQTSHCWPSKCRFGSPGPTGAVGGGAIGPSTARPGGTPAGGDQHGAGGRGAAASGPRAGAGGAGTRGWGREGGGGGGGGGDRGGGGRGGGPARGVLQTWQPPKGRPASTGGAGPARNLCPRRSAGREALGEPLPHGADGDPVLA